MLEITPGVNLTSRSDIRAKLCPWSLRTTRRHTGERDRKNAVRSANEFSNGVY
jgi:hypothetical protein